jgi:deoxyribose-phosphate aldolase
MSGIASRIDHTLLKPDTSEDEVVKLCAEARENNFAAVCIPPVYVELAVSELKGSEVNVATVVGFPLGYSDSEAKAIETRIAIDQGATEIDMVARLTALCNGDMAAFKRDVEAVLQVCRKENVALKVILETGMLTEDEIIAACEDLNDLGVDFAKTSTGFNGTGATVAAVELLRKHLKPEIRIKASGGIRTKEFAEELILAGADRIGASKSLDLI